MKHLALLFFLSFPAAASDLCPVYEFEEIQVMTVEELKLAVREAAKARLEARLGYRGITAADDAQCTAQIARLERAIARKEVETK